MIFGVGDPNPREVVVRDLSVRHSPSHDMDKDEEETVNCRVSFRVSEKFKGEKRMDYQTQKKRRREHDVHDTVYMTEDMETMISTIIRKMMMRKRKSTSTRKSTPGIHMEEVRSSMRVCEASMRRWRQGYKPLRRRRLRK